MDAQNFEIQAVRDRDGQRVSDHERELPSLPAVDTSRQAWAFVLAAFMVETLLWGPLFSIGVFTKHYTELTVSDWIPHLIFGGFTHCRLFGHPLSQPSP